MLSALFFLMSTVHALSSSAPKQILHLTVTCEELEPTRAHDSVERKLKRYNEKDSIHSIAMAWPCAGPEDSKRAAVQSLVGQLEALVEQVRDFDLIALDLPDLNPDQTTVVMPFGTEGPNGLDEDLKAALAPLERRAKAGGKLLMLAGFAFSKDSLVNEERVEHLRDFFGNRQGPVFGLTQAKIVPERFSLNKDIRVSSLVTSVATAFSVALMTRPEMGLMALAVWFIYEEALKRVYQAFLGPSDKPKFSMPNFDGLKGLGAFYESLSSIGALDTMIPAFLANLFTAIQFMGVRTVFGPQFLTTLGTVTIATVGFNVVGHMVKRRQEFVEGQFFGNINGGWLHTRRSPGGKLKMTSAPKRLFRDDRDIFGCEDVLTDTSGVEVLIEPRRPWPALEHHAS